MSTPDLLRPRCSHISVLVLKGMNSFMTLHQQQLSVVVGVLGDHPSSSLAQPAHEVLGEAFVGAEGDNPRFDIAGSNEELRQHPCSASLAWFGMPSVRGHGHLPQPICRIIQFQGVECTI